MLEPCPLLGVQGAVRAAIYVLPLGLMLEACTGPASPAPPSHVEVAVPSEPPGLAAPTPPPPPLEPTLREPGALAGHVWTYFETVAPFMGCGIGGGGVAPLCDPHFVSDPRTYEATVRDGVPHLVRRDGDREVFDAPIEAARGAQLLATDLGVLPDEVFVAGVRERDAESDIVLARIDGEDGAVVHTRVLTSPDEAHRPTGVQFRVEGGRVVVFVHAARPWLALLSTPELELLDRADAGLDLEAFSEERSWARATGSASLSLEEGMVRARGRRITAPGWTVTFDDPFGCRATALAAWRDELLAAYHCPGSSGASLTFLARGDGAVLAELHPGTIGTIGHSRYQADVDLAVEGDRAYLRGVESAGRYVAVVDLAARRGLGVLIWRQ